jgi:flagellar biosynthesis/type III secretory pathway protein FliH
VNERLGAAKLLPLVMAAAGEDEREEIVNAAEELIEQGRAQGLEQGRQEGRREGRHEGRREGAREVLITLLLSRFGTLPDDVVARVKVADTEQIDRWAERLLTASSLAEVFGDT